MRLNLDGAPCLRNPGASCTYGYSLFFRNGFFEATSVEDHPSRVQEGQFALDAFDYEQSCVRLVEAFRAE